MAVYLLALGAALLFGLGSVIQQRVAATAPPGKSLRPSLLLWLVRQPRWLGGVGTAVVGNLLSGAALGMGSVALVQPLLVARLLFAVPLSAAWQRQRLALRDWGGLAATAGGLAVFIAIGRPREGKAAHPGWWQWLVLVAVIGAITATLVFSARRLSPAREAPMLGAGAGMMFALQSAFTHSAVGGLAGNGVLGLLLNWATYAVAAAALTGTLLAQSAYELAPLPASYPALAAVEPLAGIGIGVGLLGTVLDFGTWHLAVFLLALAVMTWGIRLLATSPLVSGHKQEMAQRQAEEVVADLERTVQHELRHLESAVTWLERCSPDGAGHRDVVEHLDQADRHLARIDEEFDRLTSLIRQAETQTREAAPTGTGAHAPTPEERLLARYESEIVGRERELRARARELGDRTRTQRAALGAGGH